jgi:cytochrome b
MGMGSATMTDKAPSQETTPVWDLVIRIGHWVLLSAVVISLVTRGEPETLHLLAGYVILGWVLVRLFWGFAGPKHARFASFLAAPGEAVTYLVDLVRGKAQRHVGHSPAGGWMVLALLIALSGSAATGLAMENRVAPPALLAPLLADEGGEEAGVIENDADGAESPWEEAHEAFANLVLGLVIVHALGVALASFAHRENLVRAMVDGRKRSP